MKTTCFKHIVFLLLCGLCFKALAQTDTLYVDSEFHSSDLSPFIKAFSSQEPVTIDQALENAEPITNNRRSSLFVDLKDDYSAFSFTVKNTSNTQKELILELNNALLNHVAFYEQGTNGLKLLNITGTDYPFRSRPINDRNYLLPIELSPNQAKTFAFSFQKKKITLIIPIKLWLKKSYQQYNKGQYLLIGLYFGLCIISILLSIYIFMVLKKSIYLIYALYIVFLGLYLFSYLGLYFQYFAADAEYFNKYINVFFAVMTLVLFILFSQQVLKAKDLRPKLKKVIDIILIVVVVVRFSSFILPEDTFLVIKPFVMRIWYVSFFVLVAAIVFLIASSYKHQKVVTFYYTVAFSFIAVGALTTIFSITTGKINAFVLGLPLLFYASFIEIIFLTFTIVVMVKGIYEERNILSEKVAVQQKNFLNAFMKGENRERKRISKELHDNIGSKLSYLKRFVSDKFKDYEVTKTVDNICVDVRNLSHGILPSDLKLVGFEGAVSDLAKTISNQTSIAVNFQSLQFPELDETTAINLYRVVQESLNNIIKHAEASRVDIQLIGHDQFANITIEDNGKGFDLDEESYGLGLKNIMLRVSSLNGELSIDSQSGVGTSLVVTIPKV